MPQEWPNVGDQVEFCVATQSGAPQFYCRGLLVSKDLTPENSYLCQVDVRFHIYHAGVKRMVSEIWWVAQSRLTQPT